MIIVKLILITSAIIFAWKIATGEGMLLEKIGKWAEDKREQGYKIMELLLCPFCAASLFSLFGFAFGISLGILGFTWNILIYYPLVVFGASAVSGVSWYVWLTLQAMQGYFSNKEQLTHFEIKDRKAAYHKVKKA